MSYRFQPSYRPQQPTAYRPRQPERGMPDVLRIMTGFLVAFVIVSLLVLLAGRIPFAPRPTPLSGPTYKEYVARDRELLNSYGYTMEGKIHIPIDRAMDLIVERGLPTRANPTPVR